MAVLRFPLARDNNGKPTSPCPAGCATAEAAASHHLVTRRSSSGRQHPQRAGPQKSQRWNQRPDCSCVAST